MKKFMVLALALVLVGCSDDSKDEENGDQESSIKIENLGVSSNLLSLTSAANQVTGASDNAEIIRVIPDTNEAVLISSKARTISKYSYDENEGLKREASSDAIAAKNDDDEMTSGTLLDKDTILVTHTILGKTGDKITSCEGELVALSLSDTDFGVEVSRIAVGPMPDAVGISPNGKWAITADERDSAATWGKCPVESAVPSVTIVDLSEGAAKMKAVARISFAGTSEYGPREPEYVAIASDNDTVAVTLQDSNEVAIFSISEVMKNAAAESGLIELNEDVTKITMLPVSGEGLYTWPDGVLAIDVKGSTYFVAAGEWNDTIVTLDKSGAIVSAVIVRETEVPSNYPCMSDANSPLYSPDSLTSFVRDGVPYVAASLRYAGAVIALDFTDPTKPTFAGIAKVGENDATTCSDSASSVRPEGISATSSLIWTANEKESSVSVVKF